MKNRRKGPDFVINVVKWISIIIWVIIAIIFLLIVVMKPTSSGTQMSRVVHGSSSKGMTNTIFVLLVIQLIMSVAGIIFNVTRLKRKSDTIRLTLVFSGIISVAGLAVFYFM